MNIAEQHDGSKVAVEFPDSRIDGDDDRIERIRVGGGTVALMGVDDPSLDRLRQAAANPIETSVEFRSTLAVAAGALERIDRRHALRRIRRIEARELPIGRRMRQLDSRIRRRVRR